MKFKYILLISLISTTLSSSTILASSRGETGDLLSEKKTPVSRRISKGMKATPLPLVPQKTELPSWNFIPEHRSAPKAPARQAIPAQ